MNAPDDIVPVRAMLLILWPVDAMADEYRKRFVSLYAGRYSDVQGFMVGWRAIFWMGTSSISRRGIDSKPQIWD